MGWMFFMQSTTTLRTVVTTGTHVCMCVCVHVGKCRAVTPMRTRQSSSPCLMPLKEPMAETVLPCTRM